MSAKKEVRKDIGLFTSREALANSEGGKELIKSLKDDLLGSINTIIKDFRTAGHPELIVLCANLSKTLSLYRLLTNASSEKKLAIKELERILENDPDPTE